MTKSLKSLVAALAVLAMSGSASAANNVWFAHVSGANGAEGSQLGLTVDSVGQASFDMAVWVNNTAADNNASDALVNYAISLVGGDSRFSVSDWTNTSPLTQTSGVSGQGMGPALLTNANAGNFAGAISGTHQLGTFTLSVNIGDALDLDGSVIGIDFVVGANEWAQNNFLDPAATINVAGNGEVLGSAGVNAGTAITVALIPEPATLSLLGIGALAFIRRRR